MTTYGPYGVTCQCFSKPQQQQLIDYELGQLQQIASNMIVRVQFTVNQIADNLGPSAGPGQYNFTDLDALVQVINGYGLTCLLGFGAPPSLDKGSNWLLGMCGTSNPIMRPQDWASFAGTVAGHYTNHPLGYHIEIIECGNEDYNQNVGVPTCNAPQTAANTATAVYQAVKAVNQDILVGSPACLSHNNQCGGSDQLNACDWWNKYFQASYNGQTPLADYVNYHSYTSGVNCCNDNGSQGCYTLLQEAQYIRSQNQLYLPNNIIPIWCTEIGYVIGGEGCETSGPRTEEDQANLLTEAMEVGRMSGGAAGPPLIEVMCWYTIDYGDTGYSLVYTTPSGFSFSQAYYAFQTEVMSHPSWP